MRSASTFYIIILSCALINLTAFTQEFKILKEENSSVYIQFTFDTTKLKTIINKEELIDFSKTYYCLNQFKKPILPIFNFSFQLFDSTITYEIKKVETSNFKINGIRKGVRSKKRGQSTFLNNDSINNFIKICDYYTIRDFNGQNIQLFPIQYDSINKELICYNKIEFRVYFEKKINSNTTNLDYTNQINFIDSNFYSFKKKIKKLKSLNPAKSELVVIHNDSNELNANLIANWKNQKGIKTTLLKIEKESTPLIIKTLITNLYSKSPNLKYVLFIGNQNEIPAYNYGLIDGDNYYSDSYYGQLTNDLYPELFVGRITGNTNEINTIVKKSIYYEKENFDGDWMIKSIGIGSNEGIGEGDNGEADWQHLRKIKNSLTNFGFSKVFEFYDGDHGEDDLNGSPNKTEIISAINQGVSLINYTGHGDDNLMLTSQLSSEDLKNLTNHAKNPFIVSVACDNGKFINNQGSLAESFLKCKDDYSYTGSIAFCGSSILMDWAPPMLTQDEIVNAIISSEDINSAYSIGELFYGSQIKMLNKYNSLGNGVMQTWILFGDPTIDLKTKLPQNIDVSYNYMSKTNELQITSNTEKVLLGISENNKYLNSYIINKGITTITLDSIIQPVLLTFSKPNHKTIQYNLTKTNFLRSEYIDNINIFPNPISGAKNEFLINGLISFESISLLDILGKEQVLDYHIEDNNLKVKFENLKNGMYILKIKDSNKFDIIKRIIVN